MSLEIDYKTLPEFPGYRIGSDGSVWTVWVLGGAAGVKDGGEWIQKIPVLETNGYLRIRMWTGVDWKRIGVHQLVLNAFAGPCPFGMQTRHLNGIKSDNKATNLKWGTPKENSDDKDAHGTRAVGAASGTAKLTESDVYCIRELWDQGAVTVQEMCEFFNIAKQTLDGVVQRRLWAHLPSQTARSTCGCGRLVRHPGVCKSSNTPVQETF